MNNLKHSRGSILLETLISIVLIGLIVVGSFFSYGFVYQRIKSQRQQREALGVLQGSMEMAISYILGNPNILIIPNVEETFWEQCINHFFPDTNRVFFDPNRLKIDLWADDDPNNNIAHIRMWITPDGLDNLSIPLYTRTYSTRRKGHKQFIPKKS